ncbi:MAG: S4 domain-containing protein [Prolixibacteraceae bacterium]
MDEPIRIDKWLWSVRVYATRSLATEECKKGRVTIGGMAVKPSRVIKVGETILVRKNPVTYSYRVVEILGKRVGAKLVPQYMEDLTSPEELKKLEDNQGGALFMRDRGAGRPTKKDRRDIGKVTDW